MHHISLKHRACILLCFILSLFNHLYGKETIAVYDFVANNVEIMEVNALCDRLRNELFDSGSYEVIERGMMEEILQEQGFQQTGCVSSECAVEVGKLVGVEMIVTGSISRLGKYFSINARMVNVETGELSQTASFDYEGDIGGLLITGMKQIAQKLSGVDKTVEIVESNPESTIKVSSEEKPSHNLDPYINVLNDFRTLINDARISMAPNLNSRSIMNAVFAMRLPFKINESSVLLQYDATLTRSGRKGFIVTPEAIFHVNLTKARIYSFGNEKKYENNKDWISVSRLKSITSQGGWLKINGENLAFFNNARTSNNVSFLLEELKYIE